MKLCIKDYCGVEVNGRTKTNSPKDRELFFRIWLKWFYLDISVGYRDPAGTKK